MTRWLAAARRAEGSLTKPTEPTKPAQNEVSSVVSVLSEGERPDDGSAARRALLRHFCAGLAHSR